MPVCFFMSLWPNNSLLNLKFQIFVTSNVLPLDIRNLNDSCYSTYSSNITSRISCLIPVGLINLRAASNFSSSLLALVFRARTTRDLRSPPVNPCVLLNKIKEISLLPCQCFYTPIGYRRSQQTVQDFQSLTFIWHINFYLHRETNTHTKINFFRFTNRENN